MHFQKRISGNFYRTVCFDEVVFIRAGCFFYCFRICAEVFDILVSFAYRVVERMNADLANKNYYVILGRVPTRYVEDKIYGLEHVEQYLSEEKAI